MGPKVERAAKAGNYDYVPFDPPELIKGYDFTTTDNAIKQNNRHMPSGDPEFCIEIRNRLLKLHHQDAVIRPFYDLSSQSLSAAGNKRVKRGTYQRFDYVTVMKNLRNGNYANAKDFEKNVRAIYEHNTDYFAVKDHQHQVACNVLMLFNKLFNKRKVIDDSVCVQRECIPPGTMTGTRPCDRDVNRVVDQDKSASSTTRVQAASSASLASPALAAPSTSAALSDGPAISDSPAPGARFARSLSIRPSATPAPSGTAAQHSETREGLVAPNSDQMDVDTPAEDVPEVLQNNIEDHLEAERSEARRGKKRATYPENMGRDSIKRARQSIPKHSTDLRTIIFEIVDDEIKDCFTGSVINNDQGTNESLQSMLSAQKILNLSNKIKADYTEEIDSFVADLKSVVQNKMKDLMTSITPLCQTKSSLHGKMGLEEQDEEEETENDGARTQVKTETD